MQKNEERRVLAALRTRVKDNDLDVPSWAVWYELGDTIPRRQVAIILRRLYRQGHILGRSFLPVQSFQPIWNYRPLPRRKRP